jgi:hypothetical protein
MGELKSQLVGFTGTSQYWKGSLTLDYTDGIKSLHEIAKCYWLIQDISIVSKMKFKNAPFQVWAIDVKNGKGELTMKEDTGRPVLYRQKYSYTDFPEGRFEIWVIDGVMILPSEY